MSADSPKMVHEALCAAQGALAEHARRGMDKAMVPRWIDQLSTLIAATDQHRPLGTGGKHGDLHTATCGCEGHRVSWSITLHPGGAS